jgi:hypothetical protein
VSERPVLIASNNTTTAHSTTQATHTTKLKSKDIAKTNRHLLHQRGRDPIVHSTQSFLDALESIDGFACKCFEENDAREIRNSLVSVVCVHGLEISAFVHLDRKNRLRHFRGLLCEDKLDFVIVNKVFLVLNLFHIPTSDTHLLDSLILVEIILKKNTAFPLAS